jgi:hypothetical protein
VSATTNPFRVELLIRFACCFVQLIQQLDEELGIEKFRMELESTQVLVRAVAVLRDMMLRAAGPVPTQVVCRWQLRSIARHHHDFYARHARGSLWLWGPSTFTADGGIHSCLPRSVGYTIVAASAAV